MQVLPSRARLVDRAARYIIAHRSEYDAVEKATGVPWFMVGAIHWRESSGDFRGCLHNGDKIIGTGRKTYHVPAGRGPFWTWHASAIDALTMPPHSLHRVPDWSIERVLYETEKYNGWGYWYHGDHSSAYLWAGTNIDHGGKYVADHVWSSSAKDNQQGAAAIMKRVLELTSSSVRPTSSHEEPVTVKPTVSPSAPKPSIVERVDPQAQAGGFFNSIYSGIRNVLKRK